jgi:hypothetical protein
MSRDYLLYLEDMREALDRIDRYTQGLTLEAFAANEIRIDAVVRNLELLGEAVKHLPEDKLPLSPGGRSRGCVMCWLTPISASTSPLSGIS